MFRTLLSWSRESKRKRKKQISTSDKAVTASDNKPAMGCATMQLSYLYGQSTEDNAIVSGMLFKSEIVAKNENEGLALWTVWNAKGGQGKSSAEWKQPLNYRFVYLSKNNNDQWEAKYGYEWEDAVETIVNISAYIQVPNNNLWLDTTKLEKNLLGKWEYKEFAGIWKETKSGGKGIFNDMEVRMEDDSKCEVMCKNFNGFSEYDEEDSTEIGVKNAKYHYFPTEKKWFSIKDDAEKKQVPTLLDNSYEWIKDKKGKWEDLNAMCLRDSSSRDDKVKEYLINFCYSKGK